MFSTVFRNSHALVRKKAKKFGLFFTSIGIYCICFYENEYLYIFVGQLLLSIKKGSTEQLYAYSYQPQPTFTSTNGWKIYDPLKEYERMGVGTKNDNWRFTTINRDYTVIVFQRETKRER